MHQSIHNHCKLKVFGVLHAIGLGIWDQSHFGNKPPKTTIFVHICAQFGSLKVYIILIVFVYHSSWYIQKGGLPAHSTYSTGGLPEHSTYSRGGSLHTVYTVGGAPCTQYIQ